MAAVYYPDQTESINNRNNRNTDDIELNPLNVQSTWVDSHRDRIWALFHKLGPDRNGNLNIRQLKLTIKQNTNTYPDLTKCFKNQLLKLEDTAYNGRLQFEEFYRISLIREHDGREYVQRYCKYLVPQPHRTPEQHAGGFDQVDGSYEDEMRCCPPPLTMIIFSIIEIITFVFDVIYHDEHKSGVAIEQIGLSTRGPAATIFIYNPYQRHEAWRFMTYMFVHVGVYHLMVNLMVQLFLGIPLELVHCWWRVALVYLSGVLAGSLATSVTTPRIFLAGASGGVYALITAHIATIIMNWKEMQLPLLQFFVFFVICAYDFGQSLYTHLTNEHSQVGYMAHLAGAGAGLFVGIFILRNLEQRTWERILWWIAIIVYFVVMIIFIAIHIFVPDHFPESQRF